MNTVAETAFQGVSDSYRTPRRAAERCTASTSPNIAEADYWMDRHASYARRSSRGLASAAILMAMAAICVTAMLPLPLALAAAAASAASAAYGWWCRKNAADAWDLSMWSL